MGFRWLIFRRRKKNTSRDVQKATLNPAPPRVLVLETGAEAFFRRYAHRSSRAWTTFRASLGPNHKPKYTPADNNVEWVASGFSLKVEKYLQERHKKIFVNAG